MNITLQTLKFKETDDLKNFVQDKIGKLFHQRPDLI
jgi:hypothetical protein